MSYLGLAQAALLAAILFAAAIALAASLAYPAVRPILARMAPSTRARILLALSALPFAGAGAALLASFVPSLLSWAGWSADHCHLHPDHLHLCLQHPPHVMTGALPSAIVLFVFSLAAVVGGSWFYQWFNTRRIVDSLLRLSEYDLAQDVHVVGTPAPLAFAAGLRAPHVFVSKGMLQQLSPSQIDIVIAHERAHARRRDALAYTAATLLARLHFPATRVNLLDDLALAAEQACDEEAFAATGDRLAVAETIVAVEKLFSHPGAQAVPACCGVSRFNDSKVQERVLALLDEQCGPAQLPRYAWAALGLTLLMLAALGTRLHHATESLLGLMLH